MLNEIKEFKAYTDKPIYSHTKKTDTSYLGRFSFDMLTDLYGFQRVLTIIARGYLFSSGDPYDNIEYARRALCAWCSLPGKNPEGEGEEWKFRINFSEYHDEFPELVTEDGKGWLYSHVRGIIAYIDKHGKEVSKGSISKGYELQREFRKGWYKKLKQC